MDKKKEIDIIEDYLIKYQYYIDKNEMPSDIEKEVMEKANTYWIKTEDVLFNLRSWLEANDFDELMQCVTDYIDELNEKES